MGNLAHKMEVYELRINKGAVLRARMWTSRFRTSTNAVPEEGWLTSKWYGNFFPVAVFYQ
jgi:hypothetical protein